MPQVAAYMRISTTDQSEESQRSIIESWLARNGITNVSYYLDKQTGDNLHRPEFRRMQQDIRKGKVNCVVVYKLDRISRSMRDGINTICDWIDDGIRVVSVTQQLDFAGTAGRLVASVLFAVAEMEQSTRRDRQAAGIAVARTKGVYKGRPKGTRKASPVRARELRQQGLSVPEVAACLKIAVPTAYQYLRGE